MQKNQREIKRIHEEIKEDYAFAVKKSVVDFVLKEPEIDEDERFLDEDDETPMTIELAAVSEAWKKLYRSSKRQFSFFLFFCKRSFICHFQASHTPPSPDKPVYAPGTGGGGQLGVSKVF